MWRNEQVTLVVCVGKDWKEGSGTAAAALALLKKEERKKVVYSLNSDDANKVYGFEWRDSTSKWLRQKI